MDNNNSMDDEYRHDTNYDEGYDSNDEIKLEITDYNNGNQYTHVYSVPFRPPHCNEKRLICFSIINNEECNYGSNCTYAHSLEEQRIDPEKMFIYRIILDENLMDFFSNTNPKTDDIYKHLLFATHICDKCSHKQCTGGYNCRHGINHPSLKICKNDLLTGKCLNKIIEIDVPQNIIQKISNNQDSNDKDSENFTTCEKYEGCINGHHLSHRKLIPYCKFVHQKETSKKNKYQSVRYIDIEPLRRIMKNSTDNNRYDPYNNMNNDSDESTDEEINEWFKKSNTSPASDD